MGVAARTVSPFGAAVVEKWGADLPLSALAKRAGLDYGVVYRIVREGQEPKLTEAQAIAKALELTVDELAGGGE